MSCLRRARTGQCSHVQCPHTEQSGVLCVELAEGYCEAGESCVPGCEHSWEPGTEGARSALAAFRRRYPGEIGYEPEPD